MTFRTGPSGRGRMIGRVQSSSSRNVIDLTSGARNKEIARGTKDFNAATDILARMPINECVNTFADPEMNVDLASRYLFAERMPLARRTEVAAKLPADRAADIISWYKAPIEGQLKLLFSSGLSDEATIAIFTSPKFGDICRMNFMFTQEYGSEYSRKKQSLLASDKVSEELKLDFLAANWGCPEEQDLLSTIKASVLEHVRPRAVTARLFANGKLLPETIARIMQWEQIGVMTLTEIFRETDIIPKERVLSIFDVSAKPEDKPLSDRKKMLVADMLGRPRCEELGIGHWYRPNGLDPWRPGNFKF